MTARSDTLTIIFVGHICRGRNLRLVRHEYGADWAFSYAKRILTECDWVVCNLACCLIEDACPEELKAQPLAVEAALAARIRRSGISVLSLANYHMFIGDVAGVAIA